MLPWTGPWLWMWCLQHPGGTPSPSSSDVCPQQPMLALSTHWTSSTTEAQECQLQALKAAMLQSCFHCCKKKAQGSLPRRAHDKCQLECFPDSSQPAPFGLLVGRRPALPTPPHLTAGTASGSSSLRWLIINLTALSLFFFFLFFTSPLVNFPTFCAGRCNKWPLTKLEWCQAPCCLWSFKPVWARQNGSAATFLESQRLPGVGCHAGKRKMKGLCQLLSYRTVCHSFVPVKYMCACLCVCVYMHTHW